MLCNDISVKYVFVLNALSAVEGSRPMRYFPKFYSWDCFVRFNFLLTYFVREYSGQISSLNNFTGLKLVLVTSQLYLP